MHDWQIGDMHHWVVVMNTHEVYPVSTVCSSDIWLGYLAAILLMQQVPNIGQMAYESVSGFPTVG